MKAGAVAAATTTLRFFPTRKNKEREVTLALKKLLRHQTDRQTDRRVASHPSLAALQMHHLGTERGDN